MRTSAPPKISSALAAAGLLLALAMLAVLPARVAAAPLLEEFNGPAGAPPNPAVWSLETGGEWGNGNELEYYTASPENASLDGRGDLAITARHQTYTGPEGVTRQYTSARLETSHKFDFTYGRIAARIEVPAGAGLWPAFWALGESGGAASEEWPACGEIDVMELLGAHPAVAYGTLHGPWARSSDGFQEQGVYHAARSLAAGFHVYSADWSPQAITFAVDGHPYRTVTPAQLPAGASWPFSHPFFLILDLAVGGSWGGAPTAATPWPAQMTVDWVHVTPGAATA